VVEGQAPSGTLRIDLGGASSYDKLGVSAGTMRLAGTCTVSFVSGYMPEGGETFDILDWSGNLSGTTFQAVRLPSLSTGRFWVTNNLYVAGTISVGSIQGSLVTVR
jgi:hypothetical protein